MFLELSGMLIVVAGSLYDVEIFVGGNGEVIGRIDLEINQPVVSMELDNSLWRSVDLEQMIFYTYLDNPPCTPLTVCRLTLQAPTEPGTYQIKLNGTQIYNQREVPYVIEHSFWKLVVIDAG